MAEERLQKILAQAGVASRRLAEKMILAGQVSVNGKVVTKLGSKADAECDDIRVNGKPLRRRAQEVYLALHKPAGVVSTLHDPEGRETLARFLRGVGVRVFPVGRLEYHASGLLLLTSDGAWAERVQKSARPEQAYRLKVKGALPGELVEGILRRTGARLRPAGGGANPWYEMTLVEVRRDEVRQLLFAAGHPVEKLRRVRIGKVELASLPPGRYRFLTPEEVGSLARGPQEGAARRPARRAKRSGVGKHSPGQPGRGPGGPGRGPR